MLLYGFVWFGRNSEAEVKTINEWKRLCSREWKRLWSESEQSLSESVSYQGRHRAARAAKKELLQCIFLSDQYKVPLIWAWLC